jgi:hypothetical protein
MSIIQAIDELKSGIRPMYFDAEGTLASPVRSVGEAGSKRCFSVTNPDLPEYINDIPIRDVVIVLPNTDVDTCYGHWFSDTNSMPYLESKISEILLEQGLQTPNQRQFTIYLQVNDKLEPVPCYISTNFSTFMRQGMYVIDCKQLGFRDPHTDYPEFDPANLEELKELIDDFVTKDIPILYQLKYPDGGDGVNYIFNGTTRKVRFFGFDFSSKYGGCVINIEQPFKRTEIDKLEYAKYERSCINRVIDQLWCYKSMILNDQSVYYSRPKIHYDTLYPGRAHHLETFKREVEELKAKEDEVFAQCMLEHERRMAEWEELRKANIVVMEQFEEQKRAQFETEQIKQVRVQSWGEWLYSFINLITMIGGNESTNLE